MNNTEGGFSPFIITYKGLNLEAKLHARKLPLTITRAVIGGAPAETNNEALNLESIKDEITSRQSTAPGECATADISRVQVEGNGIASMRVTVGSGDTSFTLCMIGIMARDPDEGEILYMSASNARGDYFPSDKIIQANYDFVNILTQAEGVSVKPSLVSEVSYEEFIAHTGNNNNPHNVTAGQVFPNNSDTLSEISEEIKKSYDTAAGKAHSHNNGSALDNISNEKVSEWNVAHEHTNKKNNPHEVNAKQVGLGNVTNESKETMFTSPTFTGTPTAPTAAKGTRNKQIATTEFVTEAIENMMSDVLNAIKDLNDDKQGMVYAVALAKSEAFDDCADLNNYKITYSEYQSHTEEKEIEKFKYTTEMTSQIPNLPKYCFVFVYTTASKSGDESEVENRQYMLLPNGKFYTRVRTIWTQSGGDSEGSWGAWNELTYSDTATDTMKNNILTIPVRS